MTSSRSGAMPRSVVIRLWQRNGSAPQPDISRFLEMRTESALNCPVAGIRIRADRRMAETQTTQPSLLLRIRSPQDAQSWSSFEATYRPLVFGFLRRRGLQDADAADL